MSANPVLTAEMVCNLLLAREAFIATSRPNAKDIDKECAYPVDVSPQDCHAFYEREGVAARVNDVYPDESWQLSPDVVERENDDETEFEKAFRVLNREQHLWHYLHRVDRLSGIGRFGLLLMGLDDGKELEQPVSGVNEAGVKDNRSKAHTLIYLRAFEEVHVTIKDTQKDPQNPRYGQPTVYELALADPATGDSTRTSVHWSRVLHVADNRQSSEVYGLPRMKQVFNKLLDVKKVLGSSAEMFYKGGFPGISFEAPPSDLTGQVDMDEETLKKQIEAYQQGLQRYLALKGVTAKNLSPQVADPSGHLDKQLQSIAMSLGVPYRIFLGSEQAHLASTQDIGTWRTRIRRRQYDYLNPMLIQPFFNRLIQYGCLPTPPDGYTVQWPDLNAPTDLDKAEISVKLATALQLYVTGGISAWFPQVEFLTEVLRIPLPRAEALMKAGKNAVPIALPGAVADLSGANPNNAGKGSSGTQATNPAQK